MYTAQAIIDDAYTCPLKMSAYAQIAMVNLQATFAAAKEAGIDCGVEEETLYWVQNEAEEELMLTVVDNLLDEMLKKLRR